MHASVEDSAVPVEAQIAALTKALDAAVADYAALARKATPLNAFKGVGPASAKPASRGHP